MGVGGRDRGGLWGIGVGCGCGGRDRGGLWVLG